MPNPSRLGHFRIVLLLTPALLLSGCSDTAFHKNNKPTVISSSIANSYPEPDTYLGEKLQPNEKLVAQQISTVIEESIRKEYSPGKALRDAHPKAHGCVRAEFHVLKNIPTQLAKGVFVPDKAMRHGFAFQMHLTMLLKQILKKMPAHGIKAKSLRCTG